MHRPHIVVVGSVNVDMVVKSSRLPIPGETVTGGEFVCVPGGKGANQAVAAARLGARVSLVAKIGNDSFGTEAIEGFASEGIQTHYILRDPAKATGIALILVNDAGENLISCAPGANFSLTPPDILAATDVIRSADVVMLQLEIPLESVLAAARVATEAGVPVILDPAPAPAGTFNPDLLLCVTYLTPNETEAERISGISVTDEATARTAGEAIRTKGANYVIVTLGKSGALICDEDDSQLIAPFPVTACDTTAAGDAFNAAMAIALGAGEPIKSAVRQGCAAGALAASRLGARTSLPNADELQRFVNGSAAIVTRR